MSKLFELSNILETSTVDTEGWKIYSYNQPSTLWIKDYANSCVYITCQIDISCRLKENINQSL